MTPRGTSDSDGKVPITIRLYPATIAKIDRYVAAANGALGRSAYDRESAAAAVLQDWAGQR